MDINPPIYYVTKDKVYQLTDKDGNQSVWIFTPVAWAINGYGGGDKYDTTSTTLTIPLEASDIKPFDFSPLILSNFAFSTSIAEYFYENGR